MRVAAIFVCLLASTPALAADALVVTTFNPPRGAFAFAQTPDGFLWIGTFGDLLRHDGVSLRSAREGSDLRASAPWASRLAVTGDGVLFMGLGGAVARFDRAGALDPFMRGEGGLDLRVGDGWRRLGRAEGLRDDTVWAFCPEGRSGMWVGTEEGLGLVEPGPEGHRVTRWLGQEQGLPVPIVLALARDANGALSIGTPAGLFRLDEGAARVAGPLLREPVTALVTDGPALWAGTPHGLVGLLAGRPPETLGRTDGLPSDDVTALARAADGGIWVGTTQGVARVPRDKLSAETVAIAFEDPRIAAVFEDRDGQLWVGTFQDGVRKLGRPRVRTFGATDGLAGAPRALLFAGDRVTVATEEGLVDARPGARFATHAALVGEPRGAARDARGTLWLATAQGLSRFTRTADGAARAEAIPGGPTAPVSAVYADGDRLWLAWDSGGVARASISAEGAFGLELERGPRDGLCGRSAVALAVDRSGTLYSAHPGAGVGRVTADGRASCLGLAHGLRGLDVESVAVDTRGRVWVGALADRGLHLLDGDRLFPLRAPNGLFCDSIHEIVPTPDDGLWLVCGSGVIWSHAGTLAAQAVSRSPMVSVVAVPAANLASGPPVRGAHPSAALDDTGALWVALQAGLSRVDPSVRALRAPTSVRFDSLRVDGRSVELAPGAPSLSITGTRPSLDVEIGVPTLVDAVAIGFSFRLDGRSRTIVYDGPRRARFDELAPGSHRLEVFAADGRGGWTATDAALSIVVRAPWWRRFELWAAGLLAVAGILGLVHRLRLARLERRYQAVQTERARIARELHDALGQVFAGVTLHVDAALRLVRDKDERTATVLERAKDIARQGREELRRAIWELRSEGLESPPLADALALVVGRLSRSEGPAIGLDVSGPPPPRSVEVEFELLRVAEEALTNAITHAAPSRIEVALQTGTESVSLRISDDGRGLGADPASLTAGGHFGLVGLAERARRLDADLRIEAGPGGRGTEVKVVVPVARFGRAA